MPTIKSIRTGWQELDLYSHYSEPTYTLLRLSVEEIVQNGKIPAVLWVVYAAKASNGHITQINHDPLNHWTVPVLALAVFDDGTTKAKASVFRKKVQLTD